MFKHAITSITLVLLFVAPAAAAGTQPAALQVSALRHAGVPIVLPGRLPAGFKASDLILTIKQPELDKPEYLMTYVGPDDRGFGIEYVPGGIGSMDFNSAPKFTVNLSSLGMKEPVPAYFDRQGKEQPTWISEWVTPPVGACRLLGSGWIHSMYHVYAGTKEISLAEAKLVLGSLKAF